MLLLILMIFHLSVFLIPYFTFDSSKEKMYPLGRRYFFPLRVGLNPFKYHKNCHNFVDTLSEKYLCNHGIEDTNHFLLLCPFFATRRAINVIAILQIWSDSFRKPITPVSLRAPHHKFRRQKKNPLVNNKIHKRDPTLFNVLPYPIHPTMSHSHLSFITFILHSFVSICM